PEGRGQGRAGWRLAQGQERKGEGEGRGVRRQGEGQAPPRLAVQDVTPRLRPWADPGQTLTAASAAGVIPHEATPQSVGARERRVSACKPRGHRHSQQEVPQY